MKKRNRKKLLQFLILIVLIMLTVSLYVQTRPVFGDNGLELAPDELPVHVKRTFKVDELPPFALDRSSPYRIEFGQGSGWHGLNTTVITEDGAVTLFRMKEKFAFGTSHLVWQNATMSLSENGRENLLNSIDENRLLSLHKQYHAAVADGTQWVLWIKQGDKTKSVYFNNQFPEEIVNFAKSLDTILRENGLSDVRWNNVPFWKARQHEKELWECIDSRKKH